MRAECDKTGAPANAMNNEEVTVFDVEDDGVLSVSDFFAPTKRRDLYFVSLACSKSADALIEEIDICLPLAWEVHSAYEEFREKLEGDLEDAQDQRPRSSRKITKLTAMLEAMPKDPEKGVKQWLPTLSKKIFAKTMTERILKWFDDEPDWTFEGDYLDEPATAQDAAFKYFSEELSAAMQERVGVEIIEGDRPGSDFCSAVLSRPVEEANKSAREAGLAIRFVKVAEKP